jgi:hypothetical protein
MDEAGGGNLCVCLVSLNPGTVSMGHGKFYIDRFRIPRTLGCVPHGVL